MNITTEGFIKAAAATGNALRDHDLEHKSKACDRPGQWAELEGAPSPEQVIRHMLDCETCMGAASIAFLHWIAGLKANAIRAAVREQARRESHRN